MKKIIIISIIIGIVIIGSVILVNSNQGVEEEETVDRNSRRNSRRKMGKRTSNIRAFFNR